VAVAVAATSTALPEALEDRRVNQGDKIGMAVRHGALQVHQSLLLQSGSVRPRLLVGAVKKGAGRDGRWMKKTVEHAAHRYR
jgi:hypothetical protein